MRPCLRAACRSQFIPPAFQQLVRLPTSQIVRSMATKREGQGKEGIDKSKSQSSSQHPSGIFLPDLEGVHAESYQRQQQTLRAKLRALETQRFKGGAQARNRAVQRVHADIRALDTKVDCLRRDIGGPLSQVSDVPSFFKYFDDDWKLALIHYKAQLMVARLWILAPAQDVGIFPRLGRLLFLTLWSTFLLMQGFVTLLMKCLGWAFSKFPK